MAETTTATSWPASTSRFTWRAKLRMRSMSGTALRPNFVTRPAAGLAASVFDEFLDVGVGGIAAEHIAVFVDGDAFRHFLGRVGIGDKGGDFAVLDAADANALFERRVELVAGLRVGDIENVVTDIEAARPAELFPF